MIKVKKKVLSEGSTVWIDDSQWEDHLLWTEGAEEGKEGITITGPAVINRTGEHLFEIQNVSVGANDDKYIEVSSIGFSNLKIGDWRKHITCTVGNKSDYQWMNGVKDADGTVPDTQVDLYVPGGSDMEDFSDGDLLYGGPLDDRGCVLEFKQYDNFSTMAHCKLIQGTVDKAKAMFGWPSGFKATNHKGANKNRKLITAIVSADEVQSNAPYSIYVQGTYNRTNELSDTVFRGTFNIDASPATPAYTFSFHHNKTWQELSSNSGDGIVSFNIESTYPEAEYSHKIIHTISAPARNSDSSSIVVENKTYDLNFGGTTGGIIGQWIHSVEGFVVEKATDKIVAREGYMLYEADASAIDDNEEAFNHNYWIDDSVWSDSMLWSDFEEASTWSDVEQWQDSLKWKD